MHMPIRTPDLLYVCGVYACLQIKSCMQRASSVSITSDSAQMPTMDNYVAVTGHWIDPETWKLHAAVLAVHISNGKAIV